MRRAEKAPEPALTTAQIQPGLVLAERYRLESEIGSGSFGTVYKARHLELERPVAVKILQANVANSAEALARFRREGITACRVKHPNAVSVLDFGVSSSGVAYLVMELLEGHSLLDELHGEGTLSHPRSVAVLVPVCHVLAEAHSAGVVHRDIKPSNIFLQRTPRGEVTKVLDFGIAKIAGAGATGQDLTSAGSVLGTLAYMAPERFGPHALDGKSDVYSLGVTLFQMLAGRAPFVAAEAGDPMALVMMHVSQAPPSLRELNPAVPPAVEAVVMQTLRKQPELRPTAAELAEQLAATLGPGALVVAEPGVAPSALGAQRADSATRIAVPGDTSAFPPGKPKDPAGE
jgi:serine/threonine protein kinase